MTFLTVKKIMSSMGIQKIYYNILSLLKRTKRIFDVKLRGIHVVIMKFSKDSAFLSSLYYFLFSKKFWRENQAVLAGKVANLGVRNFSSSLSTLRRNTHRIEKGLITIPLKDSFALSYISETIDVYEEVQRNDDRNSSLAWASQVLDLYFASIKRSPDLELIYCKYLSIKKMCLEAQKMVPYKRCETKLSNITSHDFSLLCKQRRSVRWYIQKQVPRKIIEQTIQDALQAPTACNRQPFRFVVVDKKEDINNFGALPMGAATFFHNMPAIAILIGDLSAYVEERDRHVIYIDGGLAAMSFMLSLETHGLASCPINWPDIEERERLLETDLKLRKFERCIMFISFGYPDPEGKIPFSQKKDVSEMINFI